MRRWYLWLGLLLGTAAGATAVVLPPLHGELSGRLVLRGFGDAPGITWRLSAKPGAGGDETMEAVTEAPGLNAAVRLHWRAETQTWEWRILHGELDLAQWWHALAVRAGLADALPTDLNLTGLVTLQGQGAIGPAGITGAITASTRELAMGSETQGWLVAALRAKARLDFTPEGRIVLAGELVAPSAEVAGVGLDDIAVNVAGEVGGELRVTRAEFGLFGGRVQVLPFALPRPGTETGLEARLRDVALEQLAPLLPAAVQSVQGRLHGTVTAAWSAEGGLRPGTGGLVITPEANASMRLAPAPGFLTGHMQARITWLPAWLGMIARRLSVENPAYDALSNIEMGRTALAVDQLEVRLNPDGPDGARSATVAVVARPATGGVVEKVSFTINVAGPLEQVLRLGTEGKVRVQMGTNE